MKRWIAIPIALGLCLGATACREERLDETTPEGRAAAAEEHRREREEILEDHRDLMARVRALPPEERMRLHEEMHREMMRMMEGGQHPAGGPYHTGGPCPAGAPCPCPPGHGGGPQMPAGPGQSPGPGQGAGQTPGAAPDTTP